MFLEQNKPIYELPQSKRRALIPKIIILIVLAAVFYLGILLNISLLDLRAGQETLTKSISLIFVIIVIIIGIIITMYHAKTPYRFYRDHLTINKKTVKYTEIVNINPKQDFLDKIFKTYAINLGNHLHLRHIPQEIKIQDYLQQLITYNQQH
tara:strand:+ start:810 stop:1265 length:456 start_codon:yes stop_codon:yes gene_type:complete